MKCSPGTGLTEDGRCGDSSPYPDSLVFSPSEVVRGASRPCSPLRCPAGLSHHLHSWTPRRLPRTGAGTWLARVTSRAAGGWHPPAGLRGLENRVPDPHREVAGSRSQPAAVRAERKGMNIGLVPAQLANLLPAGEVPQADGIVTAGRRQSLAVRTE